MTKFTRIRKFLRYFGWGSALSSLVWGALFYLRFNNPVVNAFQDIPTQLAALESAAQSWKIVGLFLILTTVISLTLGYLRLSSDETSIDYGSEEEEKSAKKEIVEGT